MQQNFFICANSLAQEAGIAALKQAGPEIDVQRMKQIYDERRRFMIKRPPELGFGITVPPTGRLLRLCQCPAHLRRLISTGLRHPGESHVGVTPGIDFGSNGEGYLRFSYANSLQNIDTGLDRTEQYLKDRRAKAKPI